MLNLDNQFIVIVRTMTEYHNIVDVEHYYQCAHFSLECLEILH